MGFGQGWHDAGRGGRSEEDPVAVAVAVAKADAEMTFTDTEHSAPLWG